MPFTFPGWESEGWAQPRDQLHGGVFWPSSVDPASVLCLWSHASCYDLSTFHWRAATIATGHQRHCTIVVIVVVVVIIVVIPLTFLAVALLSVPLRF